MSTNVLHPTTGRVIGTVTARRDGSDRWDGETLAGYPVSYFSRAECVRAIIDLDRTGR